MGVIIRRLIRINPVVLELQYHETNSQNYAILISPSPSKNGSMRTGVISAMFKAFIDSDWNVLRFNFRNCGDSKGPTLTDESMYLSDTNLVLDWYLEQIGVDKKHFLIGGYAFGARLALETLMRRPELNGFVAVSPPVHESDFSFLTPCTHSGLLVHARYDEYANLQQINNLYEKIYGQQKDTQLAILDDVHSFRNKKDLLYDTVKHFIQHRQTVNKVNIEFEQFDS